MVNVLGHVPRDGAVGLKVTRILRALTRVATWPLGSTSGSHTLGGLLGGYGREKPLRKLGYSCGQGPDLLGTPAVEGLTCMGVSLTLSLLSVRTQLCAGQTPFPEAHGGPAGRGALTALAGRVGGTAEALNSAWGRGSGPGQLPRRGKWEAAGRGRGESVQPGLGLACP